MAPFVPAGTPTAVIAYPDAEMARAMAIRRPHSLPADRKPSRWRQREEFGAWCAQIPQNTHGSRRSLDQDQLNGQDSQRAGLTNDSWGQIVAVSSPVRSRLP